MPQDWSGFVRWFIASRTQNAGSSQQIASVLPWVHFQGILLLKGWCFVIRIRTIGTIWHVLSPSVCPLCTGLPPLHPTRSPDTPAPNPPRHGPRPRVGSKTAKRFASVLEKRRVFLVRFDFWRSLTSKMQVLAARLNSKGRGGRGISHILRAFFNKTVPKRSTSNSGTPLRKTVEI